MQSHNENQISVPFFLIHTHDCREKKLEIKLLRDEIWTNAEEELKMKKGFSSNEREKLTEKISNRQEWKRWKNKKLFFELNNTNDNRKLLIDYRSTDEKLLLERQRVENRDDKEYLKSDGLRCQLRYRRKILMKVEYLFNINLFLFLTVFSKI
jgi:hypothetical protein